MSVAEHHLPTSTTHLTINLRTFGLALIAFFATASSLEYLNLLDEQLQDVAYGRIWLILLWFFTASIIIRATISIWFIKGLRWLRSHPIVLWFLILVVGLVSLIIFEFLRVEPPLYSEYFAWNLIWVTYLILFVEVRENDWRRSAQRLGNTWLSGVMITLTTFVILAVVAELGLRRYAFSNGYAMGLIHTEWQYRHWQPTNEWGMRDYDVYRDVSPDAELVFVLGDSFAAGLGVNDLNDTFTQRLGNKLGDGYEMYLVAQPGWNTNQQIEGLVTYAFEPDVVVYSYFLNDASYVDASLGRQFNELFVPPEGIVYALAGEFMLVDFLYWNVYTQYFRSGNIGYGNQIMSVYDDEILWEWHSSDIKNIIDWTQNDAEAEIVMLIWPVLTQREESKVITQQIADFTEGLGVTTINMSDYLDDYSTFQLIANPFDMHPSAFSHQLASEILYEVMVEEGIVTPSDSDDETSQVSIR